jgi:hypothetical protein
MEHTIYLSPNKLHTDNFFIQKMNFINNALEDGWAIKKNQDKYILTKNHEGKKEIYLENYLEKFLEKNIFGNNFFLN